jgi:FKBP-type peptidyl-prolyl cis-trans isomerase 2/predicted Fe-Mo cluster-binding NifX family protein
MIVAIPSDTTDGLASPISEHFGHCAAFTLVDVADNAIGEVSILENSAHSEGGCMAPVTLLKERGVEVLLAAGMGGRPLAGFQQVGIEVRHSGDAGTAGEAVELFVAGGCPTFGESQTCGGGEGHCGGHHHHHEPETVPIEGTPDIRDGRMVTVEYELKDTNGTVLNSSAETGPMRFIFGAGQIFAPVEQALAGLEPGGQAVAEVPAAEGFGERNEKNVFEVPRSELPPSVTVGTTVTAESQQGMRFPLVVMDLNDDVARLDANHPLAGKDVVFDMTVKAVEGLK